ncbi:MAG TPA: D-glycerate dehydrogenase [Acidimicrobiia bacterium]|nr:D-glycerate dehydrogenase [Acidimicrobiia bacterium]
MPEIVVTRVPPGSAIDRMSGVAETWTWTEDRSIDPEVLRDVIVDARGLYCMLTDRIDADLLDHAGDLVVVSTMAVGVDNIDVEACRKRRIAIGHTPDVLTDSTADMAWALMMASSRRLREGFEYVTSGAWGEWEPDALLGHDISHTTLGIVGMGRIGSAVAARARGFGMDVVYTARSDHDVDAIRLDLDELLARSDHVVIAVPLTDDTHHLIGSDELAAMKPTANLVNIARGPIIDTDALVHALGSGVIRCAGLDVSDPEPIPPDHPLVGLANCIIVPHVGSATHRTRIAMADLAADNLIAGITGQPLPAPFHRGAS